MINNLWKGRECSQPQKCDQISGLSVRCYCDFAHIKGKYAPLPTPLLYQFCGQDNLLSVYHLWRSMNHVLLFGKGGVQCRPARLLGLMGLKSHNKKGKKVTSRKYCLLFWHFHGCTLV